MACALLGCVLVPAFAAFRTHLSAVSRIEADIDTRIEAENLKARLYADALSPTNSPLPATVITREIKTVVNEPEYIGTGKSQAYRQAYSVLREHPEASCNGFICVYPPAVTNSPAK